MRIEMDDTLKAFRNFTIGTIGPYTIPTLIRHLSDSHKKRDEVSVATTLGGFYTLFINSHVLFT